MRVHPVYQQAASRRASFAICALARHLYRGRQGWEEEAAALQADSAKLSRSAVLRWPLAGPNCCLRAFFPSASLPVLSNLGFSATRAKTSSGSSSSSCARDSSCRPAAKHLWLQAACPGEIQVGTTATTVMKQTIEHAGHVGGSADVPLSLPAQLAAC